MNPNAKDKIGADRRRFFSELSRHLAHATDEYPTTHCWSYSSLRKLLSRVRADLLETRAISSSFPRSERIIVWLEELGLAYRTDVEPGRGARQEKAFFLIALGAGADSVANPYELLQAFQPKGIISFFSALSFHNLTTQAPSFHHVATLIARDRQRRLDYVPDDSSTPAPLVPAKRDPLGSLAFTLDGVPFYTTRRTEHLVPGTQVHILNPQTRLRFTDLEQSLLDTLVHPLACGGESVVFEAWNTGWPKVRPGRLLAYLQEAGLPLVRRFGTLRGRLGLQLPGEFELFLIKSQRTITPETMQPLQLLRGISGSRLDTAWHVWMPA